MQAGCQTVMTSFTDIGGIPACANGQLVTDTLRHQWGFAGFVVTDWAAVEELLAHGVAADAADATVQAITAGSDMDMCTTCYADHLAALVAAGKVDEAAVRQAAGRILRVKFALGLFDQPMTRERTIDRQPHLQLAREAAAQCAILLENDGILPLAATPSDEQQGRLLVVGPLAQATSELFGTWTLDGVPEEVVSLADAVQQAMQPAWEVMVQPWHDVSHIALSVQHADAVIAVLGEPPAHSGEAHSVADPGLPAGQTAWLESLLALGQPVIAVVISGRATVLPDCIDRCAAVSLQFSSGNGGGPGFG